MKEFCNLALLKKKYDKIAKALDEVNESGYHKLLTKYISDEKEIDRKVEEVYLTVIQVNPIKICKKKK